jgi:hypothetical protein
MLRYIIITIFYVEVSRVEKDVYGYWKAHQATDYRFARNRTGHFHAEPIVAGGYENGPGEWNAPGILSNDQSQLFSTIQPPNQSLV